MISQEFKDRMSALLGGEYEKFIEALETAPAVRALRVNTLKTTAAAFAADCGISLSPLDYCPEGFVFTSEHIGRLPLHHAGAFYVQDPSAMSAVEAARDYISPGSICLDMCAAPGGKSGQIAALLAGEGFLLSNEVVRSRCRVLRGNLERLGVRNAAVTNLETEKIAAMYPDYFDFVLCDAPCSGEGMMRKYEEAVSEWSVENVLMCAERQKKILADAAKTVAPGGVLLYSTCTFSTEENEENVACFLAGHPGFHLVGARDAIVRATSPGKETPDGQDMSLCRRFYPHVSPGEGQFFAILKRDGENSGREALPRIKKSAAEPLSKEERKIAEAFLTENLGRVPGELYRLGEYVFISPTGKEMTCPPAASCFGTCAGSVVKGRFEPHHHLFCAFGQEFVRRVVLPADGDVCRAYLHGETLSSPETADGYCAVLFASSPVGGGKAVRGCIKNRYPKGLRI